MEQEDDDDDMDYVGNLPPLVIDIKREASNIEIQHIEQRLDEDRDERMKEETSVDGGGIKNTGEMTNLKQGNKMTRVDSEEPIVEEKRTSIGCKKL
jgi:hypothetical protein